MSEEGQGDRVSAEEMAGFMAATSTYDLWPDDLRRIMEECVHLRRERDTFAVRLNRLDGMLERARGLT